MQGQAPRPEQVERMQQYVAALAVLKKEFDDVNAILTERTKRYVDIMVTPQKKLLTTNTVSADNFLRLNVLREILHDQPVAKLTVNQAPVAQLIAECDVVVKGFQAAMAKKPQMSPPPVIARPLPVLPLQLRDIVYLKEQQKTGIYLVEKQRLS